MKFLILGCNGMAGHTVALYLKKKGHDVTGFARKKSVIVDSIVGDAFDSDLITSVINNNCFDSVVNCVGILNRFAEEEKDQAAYLNAYFPHFLERITKNSRTQIIHLSTDCVFSGKRGNYSEDDFRDGDGFYSRSKALGELDNQKDFTIRTSIIGPDINANGIGLLNWFMQQSQAVCGYSNAMWTGITTLQLAKTVEVVAEKKFTGLCNVVPFGIISKYELLRLFNKYLRNDPVDIIPCSSPVVNKSLISNRNLISIPSYENMIIEMSKWLKSNSVFYPHYN